MIALLKFMNGHQAIEAPSKVRGAKLEELVALQSDDALVLRKTVAGKHFSARVNGDEVYDLTQWDEILIVTSLAVIWVD